MSTPQEHDYIGLSESSKSSDNSSTSKVSNGNGDLNFKETELRLGLPGHKVSIFGKDLEDDCKSVNGVSLSPFKNSGFGAKRGFCDAIDEVCKWGLSVKIGSEVDLGKRDNGVLENSDDNQKLGFGGVNFSHCLEVVEEKKTSLSSGHATCTATAPAAKAQVVGWPPIRSFRKNTLATNSTKKTDVVEVNSSSGCLYVKVSMDGAPYLRKVDIKTYCNYAELSSALEKMFSCFTIAHINELLTCIMHEHELGQCTSKELPEREGLSASRLKDLVHSSEYVLTYEDKDGDWMLVGDVPWDMFMDTCKRLRIMKGSEAIGLAPQAKEKCKNYHSH